MLYTTNLQNTVLELNYIEMPDKAVCGFQEFSLSVLLDRNVIYIYIKSIFMSLEQN